MTTPISNMPGKLPDAVYGVAVIPDTFQFGPRLGRKKAADPRDRGYLAADRVAGVLHYDWNDFSIFHRYHKRGPQLNQGNTSRCVLFTMAQLIQSGPIMQDILKVIDPVLYQVITGTTGLNPTDLDAVLTKAYQYAQQQDEWPGEEPTYYGTSGRAGAKAFQKLGFFGNYYWLTSVEEIARYIILYGPVPVGTDWFEGMDTPDHGGYLRPTGNWRGGHEYLLDGVNIKLEEFRMRQSWGEGPDTYKWAKIKFDDFDYLLSQGGDALAIPEIRLPAKKKIISLGQPQWRKF
jgi:hypothetical protein